MSAKSFQGLTTNAGGTRVAAAKALGAGPLSTASGVNDNHTLVPYGNQMLPVKAAINMGILSRSGTSLTENNGPSAGTAGAGKVW